MDIIEKLIKFLALIALIFHISIANSIYNQNDSVIVLNAENFGHNVYNKNAITLVNFYLHWCPHCIAFSVVWKQLAEDIKGWKSVVRLAAIDCALNSKNDGLCKRHAIIRFPRIQAFGINAQSNDLGQPFEVQLSMPDMRTALIDLILKSHHSFAHNFNLFPVSIVSKNELFNALPISSQKHNLIFLERHPTHLGVELILDFSSLKDYVNIIRVHDRTGSLTEQLFVHSVRLPSLIQIHRNQSFELIASAHSDNHELLRKEFGLKIKQLMNTDVVTSDDELPNMNGIDTSVPITARTPKPLALTDLYNTLRYSLHTEVTRYRTFNSTQILVLKKYIFIIYKYFPFDNENVRRFFKRMNIWFANKTNFLKVEHLSAAMNISDGYLPPIVPWLHCGGSRPHFRGYPCGLWSLFHVLTVREYTHNTSHNSHEVLPLMRDFVINFFSCDYCAKHFEKTSQSLSSYLDSAESSVLWLWRVHNQVNLRTKGSPSEDPYFPKVQYPTQHMCPQCYQSNSQFNTTNVFTFLTQTYDQKHLTRSSEYFAEQKIVTKNLANTLIANKMRLFIILILSSSLRYVCNL